VIAGFEKAEVENRRLYADPDTKFNDEGDSLYETLRKGEFLGKKLLLFQTLNRKI